VITKISIQDGVDAWAGRLVLDVRSPAEYEHAHIPGAVNLPLFSNEERRVIGTLYKQESKQKAIKAGLAYFGPKMVALVQQTEALLAEHVATQPRNNWDTDAALVVHCWRGGMRSAAVAWLLNLYGFEVSTIVGGYKAYRRWALQQLEATCPLLVVGGCTGSGKTQILHHLAKAGHQVVDLEGLAGHKGSAFGNIGLPKQPSQEMFENALALQLHRCRLAGTPIFIEDESQRIGEVNIPMAFYSHMRSSPLLYLNVAFEDRLDYILQDYGKGQTELLINAIVRIKKRLGGLEAKTAINHLLEGDLRACFAILLQYYDKWYTKSIGNLRDPETMVKLDIVCESTNTAANADAVLRHAALSQRSGLPT
jgi:tRNA 2-selenouridine synthase